MGHLLRTWPCTEYFFQDVGTNYSEIFARTLFSRLTFRERHVCDVQTSRQSKILPISVNGRPGRVAQSVTCLATDACLTADPGVASSIPARYHTFVEIDHEIISTVILLPSADLFKKGCCQLLAKVCAQMTIAVDMERKATKTNNTKVNGRASLPLLEGLFSRNFAKFRENKSPREHF